MIKNAPENVAAYAYSNHVLSLVRKDNSDDFAADIAQALEDSLSEYQTKIFWDCFGLARKYFDEVILPICLEHNYKFLSRTNTKLVAQGDSFITPTEFDKIQRFLSTSTGLATLSTFSHFMPEFDPKETNVKIHLVSLRNKLQAEENGTLKQFHAELESKDPLVAEYWNMECMNGEPKVFFRHNAAAIGHASAYEFVRA